MELNREQIIKALECCEHIQCQGEHCPYHPLNRCREQLRHDCYALIKELTEEKCNLEYTLLGVMHSVDKWLEGKELEQDEVNRAATMREKTLQIVEKLTEDKAELWEERNRIYNDLQDWKAIADGYKKQLAIDELLTVGRNIAIADTVRKMQERLLDNIKGSDVDGVENVCQWINYHAEKLLEGIND